MAFSSTERAHAEARPLTLGVAAAPVTFDDVYAEHFPFVWRSVRRIGVHEASVDDVVQEVFLVVHKRLGEFEGRSSMKTWLFGVVRRVVAHHRRTQRRKPSHAGALEPTDLDAFTCSGASPDASAEQAQAMRIVDRLLDTLDDEKREAFVLAEFEEMTLAEIAEATGSNPNTVASRLRAARRAFEQAAERLEMQGGAR